MAAQGAMEVTVDQEREIPVFTVMKNNAILKNIFVINSGSLISETRPQELREPQDSSKTCQDFEHTLLVGRHPDCDIRLEHPSIIRFHLRIHSKPFFKRLSVTDLSSVHGTWISGKRMKPNIRVDVNEGDALTIGGSSRVYRLHWVPFCKAYDSNNPFVPPHDVPPPDEEMEEEIKRDENTLVLENGVQSVTSIQFETSEEMKDVNTVLCENEDEKSMELGRGFLLDSALEAIKALVSNHSEASKEMENENALECKTEDEKTVESPSEEASKDLAFNPSQEEEVLSVAPPPEAMNALDMSLESRDMQFVKFAWEGSETLLQNRSPLPVTLEESNPSLAMQEVDYCRDMVARNEGSPLMLKLDDNMSISGDMEEDGEEENEYEKENENQQVEQEMESPGELTVHPSCKNEYELKEKEDESQQVEQKMESPKDLLISQESSPTEIQWESSSVPALTSNLMENLDDAISESCVDETLHINENPMLPCDDEEMDAARNFWSLRNQGLEDKNETQVRNSLVEDPRDEAFSQESFPTEIHWDSFNVPPLMSNLMDSLDDAISETFADETLHINEHLMLPCDDEEMGAAWSFWSLSTQGLEDENSTQDRNSLVEVPTSGEIQGSIWSFWSGIPGAESVHSSSLSDAELFQIETQSTTCSLCSEPSKERSPDRAAPVVWSERGQSETSLETRTNRTTREKVDNNGVNNEVQMLNDGIGIDTVKDQLEEEYFTPEQEIYTQSTKGKSSTLKDEHLPALEKSQRSTATTKSCIDSEESLSAYSNKENQTPTALQDKKSKQLLSAKCTKLFMPSKEEQRTPLQALFADSPQMSASEANISCASPSPYYNKENQTPKALQEQKSSRHSLARCMKLFMPSKGEEQRMPLQTLFVDSPQMSVSEAHISGANLSPYSNKENQTPKAFQKQKSAWHSSTRCMKLSIPSKGEQRRTPLRTLIVDSPQESTSNTHTSRGVTLSACSIKENHQPKFLQEHKSAGHRKLLMSRKQAKMIPFQTLFGDSPPKNISNAHISGVSASRDSTTYENSMDKNKQSKQQVKMWTILVDVSSLLNKTSRKALQLLDSIKRTQLIIPTAVEKELDVMKQQASFFRKNTEAFLASQWIEECIVRNKCWVQSQSPMVDDGRSNALAGSAPSYCAYGTLPEDVFPSAGDQVFDYVICFRRKWSDGQLVLLSDDPTMKIKAMAEGLICETAEEFLESLVNPISKRFLWVDSLPRGRTWSYLDNVILPRNKFYPGAMKGAENAKGLKILLLDSMHK